jgi:2-oxoisovalerate dehydrogenase E2 component (dihydrolipoyl transacylase)
MINARYDDEAGVVTRYGAVHLGIATQTPGRADGAGDPRCAGRNCGSWPPTSPAGRRRAHWQGEAGGVSGSTVTITSLGPLGGVATTPVINRPEVAIIGPNRIVERPVFKGRSEASRRKLMNLSISCDHRVVDGWDAASFVQAVRRLIETPVLLLAD